MKKFLFAALLGLFAHIYSFAQCDKNITYTVSKVEFLNTDGQVERAEEGKVTVAISQKEIIINHNDQEQDQLKGTIEQTTCDWKEAFKNGRSVINTELKEASGNTMDSVVTIEGKDGKLTIFLNLQGKKMRLSVDKYEEKS